LAHQGAVEFGIECHAVAIPQQALANLAIDLAEFGFIGEAKRSVSQGRTQEFKDGRFHFWRPEKTESNEAFAWPAMSPSRQYCGCRGGFLAA
jgi:hypothetical protein